MAFLPQQAPHQQRRRRTSSNGRGSDEEMDENWNLFRNSIVISTSPDCKKTIGEVRDELQKVRFESPVVKSLQDVCKNFIVTHQNFFCKDPSNSVANLSPMMQAYLMEDLHYYKYCSTVYYDFLTTFLNKNTWTLNDVVLSNEINYAAFCKLLTENCWNLKGLILNNSSLGSKIVQPLLSSPALKNLVNFECHSVAFDDNLLMLISQMKELRHLDIDIASEVTEVGISTLSALTKLSTFKYQMAYEDTIAGLNEHIAILLFMHISRAHIEFAENKFYTISYSLFSFLENFQAQPLGQRCVRIVEKSTVHDQLPLLLPQLETLYLENIFLEFKQSNVEPLLKFKNLSKVYFKSIDVEVIYLFVKVYGCKLVEVTIEMCDFDLEQLNAGALDVSVLFHFCPNLSKIRTICPIAEYMHYPLRQASFNALQDAEILVNEKNRVPGEFLQMILKGRQLKIICTNVPEMLQLINECDVLVPLKNLQLVDFSENGVSKTDIEDAQHGLLKLVLAAPQLKSLTLRFQNFKTRHAFKPFQYLCEKIPSLKCQFF